MEYRNSLQKRMHLIATSILPDLKLYNIHVTYIYIYILFI